MFNRNDGGASGPPPEPPPIDSRPLLPTLRTWRVRYWGVDGGLEEVIVQANGITHTDTGQVVFQRFYIDHKSQLGEKLGPQPIPIRCFTVVYDYEDITPEVEESRIIH